MLPPHLLPSEADLLKCGYIAVVAALTAGMGFLAGARRLETAFFSGWGLACLLFVVAGTWSHIDLGLAAGLAGGLGAIGLARRLLWKGRDWASRDRLGFRVLLIGAPFIALVLSASDIAWDDFAFWVPNLLHLCATHQFPTLAHPAQSSVMPGYPYGLALAGFAVHLLGGQQVQTVALVWNLLVMLAAGAACANVLGRRMRAFLSPSGTLPWWVLATVGVLLEGLVNPTFVAKLLLSNMGDSATGAGLAVISALLFEWCAETQDSAARARTVREIALTCCAIVFIRQENPALIVMLLASAAAGLAVFESRFRIRKLAALGAALVPSLFIWYSWTRYAALEIPHGSHFVLPWGQWHWSLFGSTLSVASHILVVKTGYTIMAIVVGAVAARAVLRRVRGTSLQADQTGAAADVVATAVAGLAFGNIAFLLFCYLATSFDAEEASTAISFWRFIGQTGQSLMIALACVVPLRWLTASFRAGALLRAVPVAGFLLPVIAVPMYRDDLASPVPRLLMIGDTIHRTVEAGKPVMLVDVSGNGFAALVVRYQMAVIDDDPRPLSVVAEPHGIPLAQARALRLPADGYVWLADGSPSLGPIFGADTTSGNAYLFARDAGASRLVKDWKLRP